MLINENRRKLLAKLSLEVKKQNELKTKEIKINIKQDIAKLYRDRNNHQNNNNNKWKNYNNKIQIMKNNNDKIKKLEKKCQNA